MSQVPDPLPLSTWAGPGQQRRRRTGHVVQLIKIGADQVRDIERRKQLPPDEVREDDAEQVRIERRSGKRAGAGDLPSVVVRGRVEIVRQRRGGPQRADVDRDRRAGGDARHRALKALVTFNACRSRRPRACGIGDLPVVDTAAVQTGHGVDAWKRADHCAVVLPGATAPDANTVTEPPVVPVPEIVPEAFTATVLPVPRAFTLASDNVRAGVDGHGR